MSSSLNGLYVPVHKRAGSTSSRSTSPASSDRVSVAPATHPHVYSIDTLLNLADTPAVHLVAQAVKESVRITAPELVMNRKMRKAIEYHAAQLRHLQLEKEKEEKREKELRQQQQQRLARPPAAGARRTRPLGRAPERRRNALKAVEDVSWRGLPRLSAAVM